LGLAGGILTLLGIGIVGPRKALRLSPEVTGEVADAARTAIPALSDGPEWHLVSRLGTPWGSVARLRPFVEGIEVRGADCVVQLPAGASEAVFERDPAAVQWSNLGAAVREAAPRLTAATKAPMLIAGAESLEVKSAGESGPPMFVELRDGAVPPFVFGVEATLAGPPRSLARAFAGLPWSGAPAATPGPVDLRLTLDPVTLSLLSVQDLRFPGGLNGSALIFDPNPVVTSGRGDLRDGMDVDQYRKLVTVPRLDGSGYLRGSWVETLTDQPPDAREPGLSFAYSSRDPRFEEAMAYVFGDRSLARADSLGFTGLFPRPLRMHLHATQADNSWYSRPTREIILGDGGVDDAEDGDIILHETAHALHDALVPGFGQGDTRAISEGFADFWAASLTGEPCIGDWDATSYSPPCLRRADEPATWPAGLNGQPHHDGAIWSGLLWDLRGRLGRVDAERLALAALLEQGTATTWTEAARGLLRAAERLGFGNRIAEVQGALADRGLTPRDLEFELAPGESRTIALLASGRFLGRAVRELQVWGDGRIVFAGPGSGTLGLPFPAGPPTAIPCGVDAAAIGGKPGGWSDALRLSAHITVEGTDAQMRLSWVSDGVEVARLRATWDGRHGSLQWEYEDARSGTGLLPFFAAASAGGVASDSVPELSTASIPSGGIGGLRGFRLAMDAKSDDLARLVGTRFLIEEDAVEGGFRLSRTAPALPPGTRSLVLAAQPNPFRSSVELRVRREHPSATRVEVFDTLGRRIRDLGTTATESGVASFAWDGRDEMGRALPGGVYWARAEANGERAVTRLVLVR
jgi:zinc metalloprotease ZmpB